MNLIEKIKKVFKKKERMIHPYYECDSVTIDSKVTHQNIGGKKAFIIKELTISEIKEEINNGNISVINFAKRRSDLFDKKMKAKKSSQINDLKYYYVKVPTQKGPHDIFLGYVIASDECCDYVRGI